MESDESVLCDGNQTHDEVRLLGSSGCVNEKKVKDLHLCHSYLHSGKF